MSGLLTWPWWLLVPAALASVVASRVASAAAARRRAMERLERAVVSPAREAAARASVEEAAVGRGLSRWLGLAGRREPGAARGFLVQIVGLTALGVLAGLLLSWSAPLAEMRAWLLDVPGAGPMLAPVLGLAPWIVVLLLALLPVATVQRRRRELVESVERDLPTTLALLATLAESGTGLDAAIERALRGLDPDRPLAVELATFRREVLAGVPRVRAFRRLSARLDVPSVSVFVSAVVHAEHVGSGLADTLRQQADEVWNRRREDALARAQALPTRLAVPLVLCFLPGIFVFTFGPALAQFLEIADGVLRGAGG